MKFIKSTLAKIKKGMKGFIRLIIRMFKWMWHECKDVKTLIIFLLVWIILAAPAWIGYILSIVTKNPWHLTYATAYFLFWMGPFTPYLPICLTIAIGIKKIIFKTKHIPKKEENKSKTNNQ